MAEENKALAWHRHPMVAAGFTLALGGCFLYWQRATETELTAYTLGYTARASRQIPLLKIDVGEDQVGWFWIYIRNSGSKPNHNVQIVVENVGQIKWAKSDSKSTLRAFDGTAIQDIGDLAGGKSLRFRVDSIPPNGTFFLSILTYRDDIKSSPSLSVVSEESVGTVRKNHSALDPVADSEFASWPKDVKDRVVDLKKWE